MVENFRELVLSIFDCLLVINNVKDPEIGELKTFFLNLVIGYLLYLVELGEYFLLLTNALFFGIFILCRRCGRYGRNDALFVRDVPKRNRWFRGKSLGTEGIIIFVEVIVVIIKRVVKILWHQF